MGKTQTVFAGDGNDSITLGENWFTTKAYGGSGNDTFSMPAMGIYGSFYGGDGDDVFDTDNDTAARGMFNVSLVRAGAGNDKITALYSATTSKIYGEDGDDKIIQSGAILETVVGGDGNDIIYGVDGTTLAAPPLGPAYGYGDFSLAEVAADPSLATVGGDDKIYGGDGLQAPQTVAAGPGNDIVIMGSGGTSNYRVMGDNASITGMALDNENEADGDDILQMGNQFIGTVKMYGQGGNDKLIGGYNSLGGEQQEFLFGGSGDDKIWMVSPENRALDVYGAPINVGYGNLGDDTIYGTDDFDRLAGDNTLKSSSEDTIVADDLVGGNDVINGYAGDD